MPAPPVGSVPAIAKMRGLAAVMTFILTIFSPRDDAPTRTRPRHRAALANNAARHPCGFDQMCPLLAHLGTASHAGRIGGGQPCGIAFLIGKGAIGSTETQGKRQGLLALAEGISAVNIEQLDVFQ